MSDVPERLRSALADRYRIERELGAGGMATVYLAEDLKHDRRVAINVLRPELAAVLGAERFVQEIKTTAALSHPHILPLFDRDGRQILYRSLANELVSVEVRSGATLTIGARKVLFALDRVSEWDIGPDGRLLLVRVREAEAGSREIIVENFFEELKAKAGR